MGLNWWTRSSEMWQTTSFWRVSLQPMCTGGYLSVLRVSYEIHNLHWMHQPPFSSVFGGIMRTQLFLNSYGGFMPMLNPPVEGLSWQSKCYNIIVSVHFLLSCPLNKAFFNDVYFLDHQAGEWSEAGSWIMVYKFASSSWVGTICRGFFKMSMK